MRLSDAIATGRTLIPKWKAGELAGCALGMACLSVGMDPAKVDSDYEAIYQQWPWTRQKMMFPKGTCPSVYENFDYPALEIIYSIFDRNVVRDQNWTLDQLIDWVRSVEPPDASEIVVESVPQTAQVGV